MFLKETESLAMRQFAKRSEVELISTILLETELRRIAARSGVSQAVVSEVLTGITVYPVLDGDFRAAGTLPGNVRTLDALHLQGVLSTQSDVLVTYDNRMSSVAETLLGLVVLQPA